MAHRYFYIARFVLETATPLSISTGAPDGVFDSALVRDANDLPALPASTLAGVLRHLHPDGHDAERTNALFGYQRPGMGHGDNGQGSRLRVAWGALLDSKGEAVPPLALGDERAKLEKDPLLAPLLDPGRAVVRNRVRIGPRGAADDRGKFDRTVLPTGYRFAGELSLWSNQAPSEAPDHEWNRLLALLRDPRLRAGGATRAGLGRLNLQRLHGRGFDLRDADDAKAFRGLDPALDKTSGLTPLPCATLAPPAGWLALTLQLRAQDLWRIGQGNAPVNPTADKAPDALPILEPRVIWDAAGHGSWSGGQLALAPASAIKGALAHRVAFYDNCLTGRFAEDIAAVGTWDKAGEDDGSQAVRELFGYSKTRQAAPGEPTGQAGRVWLDDALLPVGKQDAVALMHNAIDRFTGGVRDRLLFSEELLWRTPLTLHCLLDLSELAADAPARRVLRLALDDLLSGRLALGAGGGKGHGRFTGHAEPGLDAIFHPTETP